MHNKMLLKISECKISDFVKKIWVCRKKIIHFKVMRVVWANPPRPAFLQRAVGRPARPTPHCHPYLRFLFRYWK